MKKDLKLPVIVEIYTSILKYYFQLGFNEIFYKAFPRMYNTMPADEIDYCLFITNAKLMDMAFSKGSEGSTFGGYPLVCGVGIAALRVF